MFAFPINENKILNDLIGFFDLLAQFDHQDEIKKKSNLDTDPLVSAPRRSVSGEDI